MIRFIALLFFALSSQAYSIHFEKRFEVALKPNILTTQLSISCKKPSEKEVLKKLTSFSNFIAGYKDVDKKGGNYTIYPEYRYENNQRFKSGYRGEMQYTISSKKADDVNTFISNIHDKKKDFDVDISLSSVRWQLAPKQKEGQVDKLRLDALLWINAYAKSLSSSLQSTCKVTKASFVSPSFQYPNPMALEAKNMATDSAPTPQQDNQKIIVNPSFELECQ